jgi:histone H2A
MQVETQTEVSKTETCKKSTIKNKRSKNFEIYISKVLKDVSTERRDITKNARQQLNSAICMVSKVVASTALRLTKISKKKTLSEKEVENAVLIYFSGDLALKGVKEGQDAITKFNINTDDSSIQEVPSSEKRTSRQGKAGIVFPPSLAEKFLRDSEIVLIGKGAPIFMAAVLEYMVAEILVLATKTAASAKHVRITVRDLTLSVKRDSELNELFEKLNISFVGGGAVPHIHPSLVSDSKEKCTQKPVILKIRELQEMSNVLTLSKTPFERLTRQIFSVIGSPNVKISKGVFAVLQYHIEHYVVGVFRDANMAAIHSGRVKLTKSDIEFVYQIKCNRRSVLSGVKSEMNTPRVTLLESTPEETAEDILIDTEESVVETDMLI